MSVSPHRDRTADLTRLARLAEDLGARHTAREADDLAARVADGRFFLASVGQFKRGKSTLLNALLGEPLLPTGVAPVTSAVTVIRYGPERAARAIFKDGDSSAIRIDELQAFTTEIGNPGNAKRVAAVEFAHPAPLLATGMCLVDTPGLGSVFEANTEETHAFIPHIDAALVVLGADPPISADELALVDQVGREVEELVFVLNKADKLTPADLDEGQRFTRDVLTRQLHRPDERVYKISATERLTGGPTRDWVALEARLAELASRTSAVVEQSARRGIGRLAAQLAHEIDEQHDALTRPVTESERRIARLEASVGNATQLLSDLAALWRSEEARIAREVFEPAREAFVTSSLKDVEAEVRDVVEHLALTHRRGTLRQASYNASREIVSRRIHAWLGEMEPRAEVCYRQAAERFVFTANGFLSSLKATKDPSFDHLPATLDLDVGFRTPPTFYFTDRMDLPAVGPFIWALDHLRSRSTTADAIGRRSVRYAERLLTPNATRVTVELRDRITESRRRLESELRFMVEEVAGAARRALERTKRVRARGEAAVAGELHRLAQHRATLRELADATDVDGLEAS